MIGLKASPAVGLGVLDPQTLTRLYAVERLDDRTIAARYGVSARRVTRQRRALKIRRKRVLPSGRPDSPPPGPDALHHMFVVQALPVRVIADHYHTSQRTVRSWLTAAGYRLRPRGDRRQIRLPSLSDPVGSALYADPEVAALLRRHQIPLTPVDNAGRDNNNRPSSALTRPFLQQAYQHIGLSIDHIAQLTGCTPNHVRHALHTNAIRTHADPGFSPWTDRNRIRPTLQKVPPDDDY